MRHEQWAHRQRIWRCPDHPQHEYSSRSAYENHVEMQHADSKLLMLSAELLIAQESVSRALDRPCPFCLREYEDIFEMQQHVAGHLEAVALLSVPNLDEDKNSAQGNSNSANSNHAESKAGDFDSTEQLFFPENEGPDDLRYSSEAEKRAFRTKLGVMNQTFNKDSSDSTIARSRYYEYLVRDWLDGVYTGPKSFSNVTLTDDVIDTYKQLAQALRVISLAEDPDEQLLHLSRAIVRFLPDVLKCNPDYWERESKFWWNWDIRSLFQVLGHIYSCMEWHMRPLRQASSNGPAIFVNNWYGRRTRLNLGNSLEESTDIILRLVDNIIRLLENIEGHLIHLTVSYPRSASSVRTFAAVFTFPTARKEHFRQTNSISEINFS